jgi:1-deoxy-D-xylulose-5-phosphate synthase
MSALPIGRGEVRREGKRVAILAFGAMLAPSLEAADELDATVANMRFVKPLDEALILDLAARHELLVTVEENALSGGAGSGVVELIEANGIAVPVLLLGLPDAFLEQGDSAILLQECGLTKDGIVGRIRTRLAS